MFWQDAFIRNKSNFPAWKKSGLYAVKLNEEHTALQSTVQMSNFYQQDLFLSLHLSVLPASCFVELLNILL